MDRRAEWLERLASGLESRGLHLATAESCTGGGLAAVLTSRPGSSAWFECGYVTYSNASKTRMLGVPAGLIEAEGAVSEAVVAAMVAGAFDRADDVDLAVAISGIAGPGGAVPGKPVGTVWLAWGRRDRSPDCRCMHFAGDRESVRQQAIDAALQGLCDMLEDRR